MFGWVLLSGLKVYQHRYQTTVVITTNIRTTKDNFDALDAIINLLSLDWKTPKKMGAVRPP